MEELFRIKGRAPVQIETRVVRDLTRADLALLGEEKGVAPPLLKRISERHHMLARTLASGVAPGEAAIICRYDASRVSILQNDPAFRELVEFYRNEVQEKYLGLHEQLSEVAIDALEIIGERMREEPEKVSFGQLLEVAKMGADRTGFGPQSSSTNLNVNVDLAGKLQAARQRVQDRKLLENPR